MNICERMRSRSRIFIFFFCVWCVIVQAANSNIFSDGEEAGFVVSKESRRTLVSTENGEIVAARVAIGDGSSYHLLHFFTMDPNSLFLPVLLHSHMVFYVHTGSGKLSWTEENELQTTDLRQGDVYRLKEGAVFFIQSNLETTERRKLRINAIFANSNTEPPTPTGPYSSIRDLVLGFDNKVLQAAFKVSEEEIEELLKGAKPPAIIHGVSKSQKIAWEMETKFIGSLLGSRNKKKGKRSSVKLFNLFKEDKDFENGNGWSTAVTNKKLSVLQDADIGLFMVNLTTGSMMGPHWNPVATEIALVLQGRGMVRVVCSSGVSNDTGCKNMRFEVEEGDIFVVPRFHPMAQMAFNNETFVFMGFSTSAKKNHPQYLAGQASVLRTLSKQVLAMSFNVGNTTMDQLLASQQDSVILGCISCAEEELSILEEEREKTREREEERHRKQEEEEAREREEEEAKRQEEERKRQEEEEEAEAERKRREEEEEEEERKQQEEEEEAEEAKREEQERKRQEEEEAAKRQEQERKRHEEEEEEEEEERRSRREEEEEARREKEKRERREEAAERREAKEERRRHEEEMARKEEEERQRQEAEEEEERQRQEEEHKQRKEEREEKHGRRRRRSEEEEAEEEERRREQEEEREEGERERRHKEE